MINNGPGDIGAAMLYDAFTPQVLCQLEAFGFCGPGEGRDFIRESGMGLDGRLPVNPHGGQLGEGYVHGMNNVVEAVRQLRGTAANQLCDVDHVLVASSGYMPTSAVILSTDR